MLRELRPALLVFALLTLVTGVAYPLVTLMIGRLAFPTEVEGSVLERDGRAVGSRLLGQPFSSPQYFWGRPSATGPVPYNGAASSGSNQGPLNPAFEEAVADRIAALRTADPGNEAPVPVDLVTASASGLDPHISLADRAVQIARVARARICQRAKSRASSVAYARPTFGVLGEPRVHVLELNLALDARARR